MRDYEIIRRELEAFDTDLMKRQEIVAINKIDTMAPDQRGSLDEIVETLRQRNVPCLFISAATGEGTDRLVNGLTRTLHRLGQRDEEGSQSHA